MYTLLLAYSAVSLGDSGGEGGEGWLVNAHFVYKLVKGIGQIYFWQDGQAVYQILSYQVLNLILIRSFLRRIVCLNDLHAKRNNLEKGGVFAKAPRLRVPSWSWRAMIESNSAAVPKPLHSSTYFCSSRREASDIGHTFKCCMPHDHYVQLLA